MKKMIYRSAPAVALAVALALSLLLAACGGGGNGAGNAGNAGGGQAQNAAKAETAAATTTTTAAQEAAATEAATEAATTAAAKEAATTATTAAAAKTDDGASELEPVVFVFGIDSSMDDGIQSGFSVFDEITRKTGVIFDLVQIDRDKFKTMAAAQDLPDIFRIVDASMIATMIENNDLCKQNDLIAKYGPNVASSFEMSIRYQNHMYGETYFFPYEIYNEPRERDVPMKNGGSIKGRYDIYKEIGSPEIKDSWNGFFDVLEKMQAYAREKYKDDHIYAFSTWVDWGVWPFICAYPFSHGYGDIYEANQMVNVDTNKLEDNFLDGDGVFWEGVEWIRDAYSRGLFDPEGLTQKYTQYAEKVQNGLVLVSFAAWLQPNEELRAQGAVNVILPNSVGKVMDLTPRLFPMGNRFSNTLALNSRTKNPERFMQMMNWMNSTEGKRTLTNGVQGETWDYVDGIPQFIGKFKDEYLYSDNWAQYHNDYPSGIYGLKSIGFATIFGSNAPQGFADDGYPYFLMNQPQYIALTANNAERAFAEDFGFSYPGEVYMQWVKEGKLDYSPVIHTMSVQLFGTLTEDIAVAVARAQQHFEANVGKAIMAPTKDDFEKEKAAIIDHLKATGYEEVSAAIAAQFNKATELVDEFTKER